MSKKRLIDFIRTYEGNEAIEVDVYLKEGSILKLKNLNFTQDGKLLSGGKRIPVSAISHAEIYAA